MNIKGRIYRNVLARWIGYIVMAVASFWMLPFVMHKLGNSTYGVWILLGSVTGYLGLLDMGIGMGLVKYISEFVAGEKKEELGKVISSSFVLYSIAGIITLIATYLIMLVFPYCFDRGNLSVSLIRQLIAIVGIQIALGFPLGIFGAVLKGYNRYDLDAFINVVSIIIRVAALIFFLNRGYGIIAVALIGFISTMAGYVLKGIFCYKKIRQVKIKPRKIKKAEFQMVFRYSWLVFVSSIAIKIIFYTDSIVIGSFISAAAITFYSIGSRLVWYLREFIALAANATMPVASGAGAVGLSERNYKLMIQGTQYCWMIALFFGLIFVALGKPLLLLWVGPGYGISYTVLVVLAVSEMVGLSQSVSGAILYGLARHKFCAGWNSANAVANLVLSLILVRPLGIVGVALGTAIPYFISSFFLGGYTCRVLEIPVKEYIKRSFLPPLIGAIPFMVYCFFIYGREIDTIYKLVFCGMMGFIIYVAGMLFTCGENLRPLIKAVGETVSVRRPV